MLKLLYSGRPIDLPPWSTECFLEEITAVPVGTEIWWPKERD